MTSPSLIAEYDRLYATAQAHKTCPFCGSEPGLARKQANFWLVGCENDDCNINPQAGSRISAAVAWEKWNKRHA